MIWLIDLIVGFMGYIETNPHLYGHVSLVAIGNKVLPLLSLSKSKSGFMFSMDFHDIDKVNAKFHISPFSRLPK